MLGEQLTSPLERCPTVPAARPAVLVVEDDAETCALLQQLLEEEGYTVETVADGAAALARLEVGGIDLVLLDWMLPEVDGLEVCRRVRADATGIYLPIIMLTALGAPDQRHEAFAACVDDYVTKPFRLEDLLDRVHVWTRTRQRLVAAYEQQQRLEAERTEKARLEAALLTARTIEHELNNKLCLSACYAERLAHHPTLPRELSEAATAVMQGVHEAADILQRLQQVTALHERGWGPVLPPTIDIERSTR